MKKIKSQDLYYIAGLIDGEGTVSLIKRNKNEGRSPYISVSSTTPELVYFLHETLGGRVQSKTKYQQHHKDTWDWRASNQEALDIIAKIGPYLKEPEKRRRAELISLNYKKLTVRNGKYTDDQLKLKREFEEEFFKNSTKV